ncbi:MAG TPA: hypothetical protein VF219_08410, partial [Vicinamibacterales bacterium]
AAEQIQSAGVHAYFPTLVKTAFGLCAAFVLLALVATGVARLLAGRRLRNVPGPSLLRVVALLFCLQLTCYVVQETIEMAAGAPAASAPALLLWGTVGQLPAAAVAALVMRWFMVRVAPALAEMLAPPASSIRIAPQSVAHVEWLAPSAITVDDRRLSRAFTRRGPPL